MGHTGVVALRIGTAPEQTLYVPLVADYLLEYIFLRLYADRHRGFLLLMSDTSGQQCRRNQKR